MKPSGAAPVCWVLPTILKKWSQMAKSAVLVAFQPECRHPQSLKIRPAVTSINFSHVPLAFHLNVRAIGTKQRCWMMHLLFRDPVRWGYWARAEIWITLPPKFWAGLAVPEGGRTGPKPENPPPNHLKSVAFQTIGTPKQTPHTICRPCHPPSRRSRPLGWSSSSRRWSSCGWRKPFCGGCAPSAWLQPPASGNAAVRSTVAFGRATFGNRGAAPSSLLFGG